MWLCKFALETKFPMGIQEHKIEVVGTLVKPGNYPFVNISGLRKCKTGANHFKIYFVVVYSMNLCCIKMDSKRSINCFVLYAKIQNLISIPRRPSQIALDFEMLI